MSDRGGIRGKPQASVHPVFAGRIKELRTQAAEQYSAATGEGQRPWQVPEGVGDLLDVPQLHQPAFDRTEANAEYAKLTRSVAEAGTVADIVALKLQIDYNAAEERAFRARHASLVRCLAHGHGRRYAYGQGRVFTNMETAVTDLIAGGGSR